MSKWRVHPCLLSVRVRLERGPGCAVFNALFSAAAGVQRGQFRKNRTITVL